MHHSFHTSKLGICSTFIVGLFYTDIAIAEDKDDQHKGLEIIEVVAQKRTENIQQVPISISAFKNTQLQKMAADNIDQIGYATPGLESNNISATQPNFNIRGIKTNDFGIGSDPSVAIYIDGIYAGRSGGSQVNFNDIERVEVLKGPQGTLFGRNAIAGAINIITKKPIADTEFKGSIQVGSFGHKNGKLTFNTALTDKLSMRASILSGKSDGYIDDVNTNNEYGAKKNTSGKLAFLWSLSESSELIWTTEFDKLDNDATPTASLNSAISPADPFGNIQNSTGTFEHRDLFATSIIYTKDLGDMEFTSLTAYKKFDSSYKQDEDGSDHPRFNLISQNEEDNKQWSQEFRLTSTTSEPLSWLVGFSYGQEDAKQSHHVYLNTNTLDSLFLTDAGFSGDMIPFIPLGSGMSGFIQAGLSNELSALSQATGLPVEDIANMITEQNLNKDWHEQTDNHGKFRHWAIYADLKYQFNQQWSASFGARYGKDDKKFSIASRYENEITLPFGLDAVPFGFVFAEEFNPANEQDKSWGEFTPRITLNYQPNSDHLIYTTVSKGYKSGGFNSLGMDPAFDPELVWNYEAGFKSLITRDLKINGALYKWDYEDLQVLNLSGEPGTIPTYNVGNADAEGKGFELEISYQITDALRVDSNYSHIETEITDYPLFPGQDPSLKIGRALSSMPENKFYVAANYELELSNAAYLDFWLDYSWVDKRLDDSGDGDTVSIDSYKLMNFNVRYQLPDNNWTISANVKNITDEEYLLRQGGLGSVIGSPIAIRGMPRTFSVEVSWLFD
ncbi:MAG: TonB-dependent receptor [Colwellia sp.]|nr:TonB-dependent receptor [Colwellia sp.]